MTGVFPSTACLFIGLFMVAWHLTMKLFPTKCHERATLRKLWHRTGNSSLLPAKCSPLLHAICQQSDYLFSIGSTHLFCYDNKITSWLVPWGTVSFVSLKSQCFPRLPSSWETLRFSGNKIKKTVILKTYISFQQQNLKKQLENLMQEKTIRLSCNKAPNLRSCPQNDS